MGKIELVYSYDGLIYLFSSGVCIGIYKIDEIKKATSAFKKLVS